MGGALGGGFGVAEGRRAMARAAKTAVAASMPGIGSGTLQINGLTPRLG
jgi:hypothetical protein